MKKFLLLMVFALSAFYFGQAMACTNNKDRKSWSKANAVGDWHKNRTATQNK